MPKTRVLLLTLLLLGFVAPPVAAITRGYSSSDADLKPGMAVALTSDSTEASPKVERASLEQAGKIIGVTTTAGDSTVTIASGQESVYVESEGEVQVYATDLDGDIKKGDVLTLSSLKGILQKALPSATTTHGTALEDFSSVATESHTVETADGSKEVKIGKIRVSLDRVGQSAPANTETALEKIGRSIVGKSVAANRVVAAMTLFVILLIIEATILYGAISSANSSLGRNPLAGTVIERQLGLVVFGALIVLVVGLIAVYFILWL